MLITLYALGIISAVQYGAAGDSRVWFFGAAVLAGVFMGLRVGIISTIVSTITYLALGWAMQSGLLDVSDPSPTLNPEKIEGWTSTAIPFLAISTMIVTSIGVLINGLNNNIRRSRKLAEELAFDQEQLETRSQALERRELQVRTAAEISRTVVAELDPDTLFQRVVDLVQTRFNLYYVGVFTIDSSGHYAVLRAGTGEAGAKMLARQHHLAIGTTSMIGYAISQKEPRIASDVGLEAYHFSNPDLPHTRSELALPMISAERVLGAITVQSIEADAFDEDDIVVYQGVADSLATALVNANLFQQVQTSLEEVQALHRQYLLESWGNIVTSSAQELKYTYEQEAHLPENVADTPLPPTSLELPLLLRDQAIGNLTIEADRTALTPHEHAFIEAVTQQTVLALENIRLVEETQRTAQQDRIVSTISEEFSRAMDVESVIKIAVLELSRLPNVTEVSVHIEPFANDK
jgi:GAF domain-containing protein